MMKANRRIGDAREREPNADLGEAPRTQGIVGQVTALTPAKGYGFLVGNGLEYFFHRSSFLRPADFDRLEPGKYVLFQPSRGPKGLRAEHLELA